MAIYDYRRSLSLGQSKTSVVVVISFKSILKPRFMIIGDQGTFSNLPVTLENMRIYPAKRESLYYLVVIAIWTICVAARLKLNGLVYNLDYGLFQPDGMYYSFKTLEFLGWSDKTALAEVINWYQGNSAKFQSLDVTSFNNPSSTPWVVTQFRIIYPLLSVPFVYLFGLSGMLVVPALSLLCFFLFIQKVAFIREIPKVGTILILLFSCSPTLLRWTTVNYSDALLLALFSLFAYLTYTSGGIWSTRNLILLSLLIFLSTFTRQSLPIWLPIGIYFLLIKNVRVGLITILTGLACSIPSILTFPYGKFLGSKQEGDILPSIYGFFSNAIYVNLIEIAQLVVLDRTLLIILLFSCYCGFKSRDEIFGHLCLVTFCGGVLINSLVGVAGVNFRYLLPVLPFAILVIIRSNLATTIEESLKKYNLQPNSESHSYRVKER